MSISSISFMEEDLNKLDVMLLHAAGRTDLIDVKNFRFGHDHQASMDRFKHMLLNDNNDDLEHYLAEGFNPNVTDKGLRTPLHYACDVGNLNAVKALLEHGANPRARDYFGWTPMHNSASSGAVECSVVLRKAGANPTEKDFHGFTPMHVAEAAQAKLEMYEAAGFYTDGFAQKAKEIHREMSTWIADPIVEEYNQMLLDQQLQSNLIVADQLFSSVIEAIRNNDSELLEEVLCEGINPNLKTPEGLTPLMIACSSDNIECANVLLNFGANPNLSSPAGLAPIHIAVMKGHTTLTMELADRSVIDMRTNEGHTALHLAAMTNQTMVSEYLIAREYDPSIAAKSGQTPIDIARFNGHIECASLMNAAVQQKTKEWYEEKRLNSKTVKQLSESAALAR